MVLYRCVIWCKFGVNQSARFIDLLGCAVIVKSRNFANLISDNCLVCMSVNTERCINCRVAHDILYGLEIDTLLNEICTKRMAQMVRSYVCDCCGRVDFTEAAERCCEAP